MVNSSSIYAPGHYSRVHQRLHVYGPISVMFIHVVLQSCNYCLIEAFRLSVRLLVVVVAARRFVPKNEHNHSQNLAINWVSLPIKTTSNITHRITQLSRNMDAICEALVFYDRKALVRFLLQSVMTSTNWCSLSVFWSDPKMSIATNWHVWLIILALHRAAHTSFPWVSPQC